MSLLTIIKDAASRIGVVEPAAGVGSNDPNAKKLVALANQEGRDLQKRLDWQALVKEQSWSATATEEQANQIPDDFDRMLPKTFWNRTTDRPVAGPLSAQRWQLLKSGLVIQPWDAFRIRGGSLLMSPTPTASDALVFEYVTKYWCGSASDTEPTQSAFTSDSDIIFLDEEAMTLGLVWRWKKSVGVEYGEDFQLYEDYLSRLMVSDGVAADIDMGTGDDGSAVLDPYVTDGNWSIS